MRERDLPRATEINAQIKKCEECITDHDRFGKYLRILFELPAGEKAAIDNWADVAMCLAINGDALHARTNIVIRALLEEQMNNLKAELRKLGIKLESDEPAPKVKKQPLRLVDKSKENRP